MFGCRSILVLPKKQGEVSGGRDLPPPPGNTAGRGAGGAAAAAAEEEDDESRFAHRDDIVFLFKCALRTASRPP